ncbi:MAG: tRNA pseudouridine(55) synthase TruB [Bacillota bacterium]|nr:tRNA pseudouridine(55) synthase TruB [Bacillota bacterium]
MNGLIIVNKHQNVTSHDIVNIIRRLIPAVKIGHTGTLDPMATGVLPICIGKATRLAEYITELPKKYRAGITLGVATDTDDATGITTAHSEVPGLIKELVEEVMHSFEGTILQKVPAYSAIKYKGKPLYHWVRKGSEIPRKLRNIDIYSIKLIRYDPDFAPHLLIEVECSKGTYIRTLAFDLGEKIGCPAHLSLLERLSVGLFTIEESLTIDEIHKLADESKLTEAILPMDRAVAHFPKLELNNKQVLELSQGKVIEWDKDLPNFSIVEGSKPIRVYDEAGQFRALVRLKNDEYRQFIKTLKYLS